MNNSCEKQCPKCGIMLDYVIEGKVIGYWCHNCDYACEIVRKPEVKDE